MLASLELPVLREALRICERSLYEEYRREALLTQTDYHDRDGYLQPLEEVSWLELDYALRDEPALVAWTGEEGYVHRLFSPESREGLLRWSVRFDHLPIVGGLDFTAPREVLMPAFYQLERMLGESVAVLLPSAPFFDKRWRAAQRLETSVIDPTS